jgi:hypothetical protein
MSSNSAFISYRRSTSSWIARAVFQDLEQHSIDTFIDVESIDAGDYRDVIHAQICARPYFLPVLTPMALERCVQADDLLRSEIETAVGAQRRIVPLVTADFDRTEVTRFLPGAIAEPLLRYNTVTVEHEYFEASMTKLRERFLRPIAIPIALVQPALARRAEELVEAALSTPKMQAVHLNAQKHLEQAFALAAVNPERAADAWGTVVNLLVGAEKMGSVQLDFGLAYRALQQQLARDGEAFTVASNVVRAMHDMAMTPVRNIR